MCHLFNKSKQNQFSRALRLLNDALRSDWLIRSSTFAVIGQWEILQFWLHVVLTTKY